MSVCTNGTRLKNLVVSPRLNLGLNLLFFGHGAQGLPRRSRRSGSGRRGVVLAAGRSRGLNVGEAVGLVVGVASLARAHEGAPPER